MVRSTQWWVFTEDLASALIGPFPDKIAARCHPQYGDAVRAIIPDFVANHLTPGMTLTPEQDIASMKELGIDPN